MHLIKQTLGLRFLSKKFIHDGKIELVSVSLKMAKMVPGITGQSWHAAFIMSSKRVR